jgi:hypothetical protein
MKIGMIKMNFFGNVRLLLQPVEEKEKITKLHQQGRSRILLNAFSIYTLTFRAFLRPMERISLMLSSIRGKIKLLRSLIKDRQLQ